MDDNDRYRRLFPISERFTYLNHAAVAPISLKVAEEMSRTVSESLTEGGAAYGKWTDRIEKSRQACASLIGASSREIAFLANTSDAMGAIAGALKWRSGDRVLVSAPDFPTVIYPWYPLKKKGIEIGYVERKAGRLYPEDLEAALSPGTRILALGGVDFLTGFACDLEAIGKLCKRRGILFCVDAIQQLGVLPMDVKGFGIDFLACGSHKWLMGPMGCGILYVSEEVWGEISPDRIGWKSVPDEEDFFTLKDAVKPGPHAFEAGSPNVCAVAGLGAAVRLLLEEGIERISKKVMDLTSALADGIKSSGLELATSMEPKERSGIISFRPQEDAKDVVRRLFKAGIAVSERRGLIRVSPHFYNTFKEVEVFISAISGRGETL
jgi:selenocysteine lyase/cysteine desulfurase